MKKICRKWSSDSNYYFGEAPTYSANIVNMWHGKLPVNLIFEQHRIFLSLGMHTVDSVPGCVT